MYDRAISLWGSVRLRMLAGILLVTLFAGCSADTVGVTGESTPPGVSSLPSAAIAGQAGEQARMADSLVESIGVNVHINYGNYADVWTQFLRSRILELGVRHLRDLGEGSPSSGTLARAKDLHNSAGIKFGMACRHQGTSFTNASHCIAQLNTVRQSFGGSTAWLDFVGGENEMDGGDANYVQHWAQYQTALYKAYNADPVWRGFPVLMSSIARKSKVRALGYHPDILDIGDMHSYPGGNMPSQVSVEWISPVRTVVGPGKPLWSTETGYHNALQHTGAHYPISERGSGKYVGRLWFEYWNRGVDRSYSYEMWDEGTSTTNREDRFGLLRHDGTPKPQYTVTKNVIALLTDRGAAFTPGRLDYALSGGLSTTHTTLLQKRDGRFYLALWQEVSVWDRKTKKDLTNPDDAVTLTLAQAASAIRVYRPGQGTSPIQTGKGTSISLAVPDEVILVEIVR